MLKLTETEVRNMSHFDLHMLVRDADHPASRPNEVQWAREEVARRMGVVAGINRALRLARNADRRARRKVLTSL